MFKEDGLSKNTILAERLRRERNDLHLTQAQFAERCDLSEQTIKKVEAGHDCFVSTLVKISSGINISCDYLVGKEDYGAEAKLRPLLAKFNVDELMFLSELLERFSDSLSHLSKE